MPELIAAYIPQFAQPDWLWFLLALPAIVWARYKAPIIESGFKRLAGTFLRCACLAVLVIALAGPLEDTQSNKTDIVFVLDVSRSIDQQSSADALVFINRVLAAKGSNTRAGLVVFGTDAAVDRLLSESTEALQNISTQVSRGGTDIARAIEVAVGTFQIDGQRRLVLLSDGQENQGKSLAVAAVARSLGVSIDTIALQRAQNHQEVLIQDIDVPEWVYEQEPFEVEIIIASQIPSRTQLVITRNGSPVEQVTLDLIAGINNYTFIDQSDTPGLYEYEAIVNSEHDSVLENNRFQTFVQVRGASRILHAVGDAEAGKYVTDALQAQGFLVDQVLGSAVPATMHELTDYALIILDSVSALDMSLAKMQLIEDYVRDAGGGLIMLGGDKSYGAGGYLDTPIERALPVTIDIKTEIEIPSLAVTIIIDRSGSMSSRQKLAVAKDAAYSAIQILRPIDTVGVLNFADEPEWSFKPRAVGNRRVIVDRLRELQSGGSTNLHAALKEAHRVMQNQPARVKHMILLSDGLSSTNSSTQALVEKIAADGHTLSTVAFGGDANQPLMESIAAIGGGRYYYTKDPNNVPRIFTSETLLVARNLFVEEIFSPQSGYPGELLAGFDTQSLPDLSGYQRVYAKPSAQVLLGASQDDPLLVSWRYGLGKSVAFTSDLSGRWGRQWVQWDEFARFIGQTARWTMRRHGNERLLPQFQRSGQVVEVLVDALDRDDRYINGLEFVASVRDPARNTQNISLQQIAPGRYQGEFPVPKEGRYYISLTGRTEGLQVGPETFGLANSYSPEFLNLGLDIQLLKEIAAATSGRMLPLEDTSIATILENPDATPPRRGRVWWPALLAALLLLLTEIAVRKLALPETWQLRLNRWRKRSSDSADQKPDYEELVADIKHAREAHISSLTSHAQYDSNDPAALARLYIPKSRRE